jgi:hypothetical protein
MERPHSGRGTTPRQGRPATEAVQLGAKIFISGGGGRAMFQAMKVARGREVEVEGSEIADVRQPGLRKRPMETAFPSRIILIDAEAGYSAAARLRIFGRGAAARKRTLRANLRRDGNQHNATRRRRGR